MQRKWKIIFGYDFSRVDTTSDFDPPRFEYIGNLFGVQVYSYNKLPKDRVAHHIIKNPMFYEGHRVGNIANRVIMARRIIIDKIIKDYHNDIQGFKKWINSL